MNFEQKVKSMSAKEIIMAMVEGLQKPRTDVVDMGSYGHMDRQTELCYGCAATNTIAAIGNISLNSPVAFRLWDEYLDPEPVLTHLLYTEDDSIGLTFIEKKNFVEDFELAINALRSGDIRCYNIYAEMCGIAKINEPRDGLRLPVLLDDSYRENLESYIEFANQQETTERS